jgi:hypothetical protein
MCQDRRVLSTTCCDGDFFAWVEEVVAYDGIVDFGFEDVVEAFFAEFLQGLWALWNVSVKVLFWRRGTFRMGRRVWHSSQTALGLGLGFGGAASVWFSVAIVVVGKGMGELQGKE